MKKLINTVILSSIITLSALANEVQVPVIEVVASAEKDLTPDLLTLHIELWSKSKEAEATQKLMVDLKSNAKDVFEDLKIEDKDIIAEQYQFGPETTWDQSTNQNKITGFRSSQNLKIVVRKVDEVGKLIDELIDECSEKNGGVIIQSVEWGSTGRAAAESETLAIAIKEAKAKAELMAQSSESKIKGLQHLSSFTDSDNQPQPRPFVKAMALGAQEGAPSTLGRGNIKVKVQVRALYRIE